MFPFSCCIVVFCLPSVLSVYRKVLQTQPPSSPARYSNTTTFGDINCCYLPLPGHCCSEAMSPHTRSRYILPANGCLFGSMGYKHRSRGYRNMNLFKLVRIVRSYPFYLYCVHTVNRANIGGTVRVG